jgi:hypothetical protein
MNKISVEILEDEIISIEEYDTIDTIDIEVDSKHRLFFANDILTHNSGWDNNDIIISNVSESGALLHTVDGLFAIVSDAEMKARGEFYLKYLADRVSGMENTRKRFEFIRKYGRIEEDLNSQIEDMCFIAGSVGGFRKTHSTIDANINKNLSEKEIQSSLFSPENGK